MIGSWICYFLGLAAAVVFHAYYFGWYSWFVLQLTVLLPLFSLLVSLPSMLRAGLTLEGPSVCRQHEAVFLSLKTAGGALPVPRCCFRLRMTHGMTGQKKFLRQKVGGQERWYVKVDTDHAGAVYCRPERIRVYDYLRLFQIPMRGGPQTEILIRPMPVEPDRRPDLSRFLTKSLRPKPGGGFSEEHEMRTYRPGDMLRDIHWKLSAKTDDLIVREAQEPVRSKVVLTLDLCGSQEELDHILGVFLWLSNWLLEHGTPHRLIWIDPKDCSLAQEQISDEASLEQVLIRLLRSEVGQDLPSIADHHFRDADWRYHIAPEKEVGR